MSSWPSTRARQVLAALLRIGWRIKRQDGSHRVFARPEWPDFTFAFHDAQEIGPRMLARIAKRTRLQPEDLSWQRCDHRHLPNVLEPTPFGLRSCVAPASRRGSGLAFGCAGTNRHAVKG
jgi:predicted RNA binding protein YcfA (HicA-like mRNA interferase family)